jgi:ribose/xylose/arabinose/galactoside ABC-type transport system permease subunit
MRLGTGEPVSGGKAPAAGAEHDSASDVSEPSGAATAVERGGAMPAWMSIARMVLVRRQAGLVAAIVATMVVFTISNSFFLSTSNLLGLVRSMATFAIIAFGETFVLISGEIDLSLGSIYGLSAMSFGLAWMHGTNFVLAFALGLLVGLVSGLVNAFFTTIVRVPSFITTLGTLSLLQGVSFLISNSQSINPPNTLPGYGVFQAIGASDLPGGIPVQIVWLLGLALFTGLLLHRTLFGFRVAAIGGNPAAARLVKLPVVRYKFWVFAIAGLLAALAGILDFSFIGSTTPTAGSNLTFQIFAAVIIGGASLSGGRGTIIGTVIGAFFLSLLNNGLSLLGVGTFAQLIFVGLVTIGAVAVDRWTSGRANDRATLQI